MDSSTLLINLRTLQGELQLPFQPGSTLRDILIAGSLPLRSACAGNAACGQCQVRVQESAAIAFTPGEIRRLSPARLNAGWRLACQIKPLTPLHVSIKTLAPAQHWRALREEEYSVSKRPLLLRSSAMRYGMAIDLGTTHIRLTLWDMRAGKRLAGRISVNPQASYGADILTRLTEAARSKQVADAIAMLARTAIAKALVDMTSTLAVNLHDIGDIIIVGNTAMLSLLSGKNTGLLLDPDYWTQRFAIQPDNPTLLNKAWALSDQAHIRFMTPLGGFMGSDLLAGIIATRLIEQPAGSLLIDFGTNSEMALWDGKKLRLTSTAGGPAFEGCGISCGMSAEPGAIYRITSGADSAFKLGILGGKGKIKGLCGSGLVDAVAWLRRQGKVDKLGRYLNKGSEGFVLSESRERIVLKPADIDVFQRAKASIGAGVCWLCNQAGMPVSGLNRVYACGAFGRLLDVSNAQEIGLLPPVPVEKIQLEANSALAGCEELLLSAEADRFLARVLAVSELYNMGEDNAFENLFVENLYLQPMRT